MKLETYGKIAALMAAATAHEAGLGQGDGEPLQGKLPLVSCALADREHAPGAVLTGADKYLRQQQLDFASLVALSNGIERTGEAISAAREDTAVKRVLIEDGLDANLNIANRISRNRSRLEDLEGSLDSGQQRLKRGEQKVSSLARVNKHNGKELKQAGKNVHRAETRIDRYRISRLNEAEDRLRDGLMGLPEEEREFVVNKWYVGLVAAGTLKMACGQDEKAFQDGMRQIGERLQGIRSDSPEAAKINAGGMSIREQIHDMRDRTERNDGPSIRQETQADRDAREKDQKEQERNEKAFKRSAEIAGEALCSILVPGCGEVMLGKELIEVIVEYYESGDAQGAEREWFSPEEKSEMRDNGITPPDRRGPGDIHSDPSRGGEGVIHDAPSHDRDTAGSMA